MPEHLSDCSIATSDLSDRSVNVLAKDLRDSYLVDCLGALGFLLILILRVFRGHV
jgi:hypothetical protein